MLAAHESSDVSAGKNLTFDERFGCMNNSDGMDSVDFGSRTKEQRKSPPRKPELLDFCRFLTWGHLKTRIFRLDPSIANRHRCIG